MLWGEVFAGGYGGMIARARPGLDPGPQTVRTTIRNWCDENGMPVKPSMGRYEGGDDAPSIADDSEVAVIAGHLSRFVIDVLTRPTESQYGQSAYMIGIGVGWIFNGPFETYPVDVGTPEEAISGDVDIAEQTAELVTIAQLLKEYSSGSTDLGRDN